MKTYFFALLIALFISTSIYAQTKKTEDKTIQILKFNDEKTKALKGELVSELTEKNAFNDYLSKYKYIYQRKDSLVTFYIYREWERPASGFDELKEYTFHTNVLQDDDSFVIDEFPADDNFTTKYYTLNLRTIEGKEFKINTYNRYKSTPDRTSTFTTFVVKSLEKSSLEKLLADLKAMIPKP